MRPALSLMALAAVVGFTACSNAIYYYQSDRVSLTLETRPDPTQPVQGNLGLKQRIAVITPGIESVPVGGENQPVSNSPSPAGRGTSAEPAPVRKEAAKGEALSMIGSFEFGIGKATGVETGPVIIKAALICGDAARQLDPSEAQGATEAFTVQSIPTYDSLAVAAIEKAREGKKLDELEQLVAKDFESLNFEEKTQLGQITGALSNYNKKLHNAIQQLLK